MDSSFYTVGQRKGIGIAAPEPLYVLDREKAANTLVVGSRVELGETRLRAEKVNWTSGDQPDSTLRARVQIRYRARPTPASITPVGKNVVDVEFDHPLSGITPGQAAVFYSDDACLGGGEIQP